MSVPDENIDVFNTTAVKLRDALKAGNIAKASEHWSSLEEKGLLHILGLSHMEGYSTLITSLSPINNPGTHWDETQEVAAERIALGAATVGKATGALSTCMLYHLTLKKPDAALELYRKYVEQLSEENEDLKNSAPSNAEQDSQDSLGLSMHDNPVGYSPGRSTVLLMAVAAHAMTESFTDALRTYLQTTVRISQNALQEKSSIFSFDQALKTRVTEYVRRLETARMLAHPAALRAHIENLVNAHAVERIKKHYQVIVEGMTDPGAYIAISADAVTSSKPLFITEASWGYFLTAFLRCRRADLAEKLWDDMIRHKAVQGVVSWTALFDGYDTLGKVEDTVAGWKTMLSQNVKPNGFTYRSLISVLCTARRPDDALKSLAEFEKGVSNDAISSDRPLPLYNTLIHGLLTNSREEDATTLLHKMQAEGPKPDLVTYNTFLRYFGRRGDFKSLGSTLQKLASEGLVGDAFTFTTILSALLKAGRGDAEEITFNLIKKQNVAPSVGFYTAIIDHQVRQRDPRNLKAALNILKRMERDPEIQVNVVPYTSILAGIYRMHWAESKVVEECKEYVVNRMNSRKIYPNRVTYHILLAACLENPEPEGLQNLLLLYREMRKRHVSMSNDTWYIIFHGLIDRKEWVLANDMVEDLVKIGDVKPVGATLDLVRRIRKRVASKT